MTDRSVPFEAETPCDNCGAIGSFDFMGDFLCVECSSGDAPWEIEMSSQSRVRYRDSDTLVAVSVHSDGTFSLGGYQDNIPARFIDRLQSLKRIAIEQFGEDWCPD